MDYVIAEVFGINVPKEVTIEGGDEKTPFVPEPEEDYRFRTDVLSDVLAWLKTGEGEGLYLTGPTGSGKSSLVCQVAARLNIPVQRVTAQGRMEMPELVGHHTLIEGDMVFVDGPLTTAMRHGHLFLLDEIDLLDPSTAAGLNGIVEGAPLVIPENGGEVVRAHPGFRFVATGNTAGGGDRTGLYQGTLRQNLAFLDRFWVVEVGYPDPDQEMEILEAKAGDLPRVVREKMVAVAGHVRKLFMGDGDEAGAIEVTMSTRTLVRWAQLAWFFGGLREKGVNPVIHALDRALTNRALPETRQAILEIVQREMGEGATSGQ